MGDEPDGFYVRHNALVKRVIDAFGPVPLCDVYLPSGSCAGPNQIVPIPGHVRIGLMIHVERNHEGSGGRLKCLSILESLSPAANPRHGHHDGAEKIRGDIGLKRPLRYP